MHASQRISIKLDYLYLWMAINLVCNSQSRRGTSFPPARCVLANVFVASENAAGQQSDTDTRQLVTERTDPTSKQKGSANGTEPFLPPNSSSPIPTRIVIAQSTRRNSQSPGLPPHTGLRSSALPLFLPRSAPLPGAPRSARAHGVAQADAPQGHHPRRQRVRHAIDSTFPSHPALIFCSPRRRFSDPLSTPRAS